MQSALSTCHPLEITSGKCTGWLVQRGRHRPKKRIVTCNARCSGVSTSAHPPQLAAVAGAHGRVNLYTTRQANDACGIGAVARIREKPGGGRG